MIDMLVVILGQQKMSIPVLKAATQSILSRPSLSAKMPGMTLPKKDAPFKIETRYDASSELIPCSTA